MTVKIDVKGPIISNDEQWIYDLFEMDATSPNKVSQMLADANGQDVVVSISSEGGYVESGSQIYTDLKSYEGQVTTEIKSLAASAASVIAMAGDKIRIAPTAQIMIHNASMGAQGDHRSMEQASDLLKVIDRSIVNAYVIKTGKTEEELLSMMAKETWMNAQDALEHGFVDEIMFMNKALKATASSYKSIMLPQQVINNLRNSGIKNEKKQVFSKEDIREMFAEFKTEILNELHNNQTNKSEPEISSQSVKNSVIANLFLNL